MKLVFAHILFAAYDGNVREGRVKSGFYSLKISEKSTYEHLSARNTCSFFCIPRQACTGLTRVFRFYVFYGLTMRNSIFDK